MVNDYAGYHVVAIRDLFHCLYRKFQVLDADSLSLNFFSSTRRSFYFNFSFQILPPGYVLILLGLRLHRLLSPHQFSRLRSEQSQDSVSLIL